MHEVLAYGGHHTVVLRPLYADEEGVFPEFVREARGYELIDSRGRRFVDWLNCWGPVLLGYRHPEVEEALIEQMKAGPMTSLSHEVEVDVAEAIVDMVPCAEMVSFGKNGSDVVTAAVRLARAVTGRDMVLQFGFHGFHDWFTCQYRKRSSQGVPKVLRAYVQPFPYNDLAGLERLLMRYPDEVAAVVMEPVTIGLPQPGYLEGVRELAHRHGALLVFDEMVTGFRLARGGAQEHFGVVPDLACFGKGLANGMPLAAIVGGRDHMKRLPSTSYGMTFRGETLSLAAARATLKVIAREPVVEHLATVGERVREGFRAACDRQGVSCRLEGPPARMTFVFDEAGGMSPIDLRQLFIRECARNGILTRSGIMPSYAHDDAAIEETLPALETALGAVAEAIERARGQVVYAIRDGFTAAAAQNGAGDGHGSIDVVTQEGPQLRVEGWLLGPSGPPDVVEFVAPDGTVQAAVRVNRPDLTEAFPQTPDAQLGGWSVVLPPSIFAPDGDFRFTIRALQDDAPMFTRDVVRKASRTASTSAATLADDGTLHI
jgi:glutamate-1-semialdehyde 2,1-aminomutase